MSLDFPTDAAVDAAVKALGSAVEPGKVREALKWAQRVWSKEVRMALTPRQIAIAKTVSEVLAMGALPTVRYLAEASDTTKTTAQNEVNTLVEKGILIRREGKIVGCLVSIK